MTELSEVAHFWRTPLKVIRSQILAMGVVGYIIDSNERWTSFVSLDESELDVVEQQSSGIIMRWLYAADGELVLTLLDSGLEQGVLRVMWGGLDERCSMRFQDSGLIHAMYRVGMVAERDSLLAVAKRAEAGGVPPKRLRELVADALGLPPCEWISPRYVRRIDFGAIKQQFPNAEDLTDEFLVN